MMKKSSFIQTKLKNTFQGNKWSYLVTLAANSIAFVIGTAMSWSSPMIAKLEDDDISGNPLGRKITDDEETWVGSLAPLGSIFGPFIFGPLLQLVGRKITVSALGLPFLGAYLTIAFAETIELYYFARTLMGIGLGGIFCIVGIYIVEISEDVNRGLLASSSIAFFSVGQLFSFCLGPYVSIMAFNLTLAAVSVLAIIFFWTVGPETPLYLVSKNRENDVLKSLRYLRRVPDEKLQEEIDAIKLNLQQKEAAAQSSVFDIFKSRANIKAFTFGMCLITFQQLSGVNIVLYYAQNIFKDAGSDIPSEISSIIIGFVMFFVACICPPFVEKSGRRFLLLITVAGAASSLVVLGVYFYIKNDGNDVSNIGWLPLLALVAFIAFCTFGLSPTAWTVTGEILPSSISSKASTIIQCWSGIMAFLGTKFFNPITQGIGMAGSFWLYGGICYLCEVFVYFFIFETKGKSLAEIQRILNK